MKADATCDWIVIRWAAIAGKMAEKTSKQCRRRWQIIMNLIGKKGGWSEEEDRLLLEVSCNTQDDFSVYAQVLAEFTGFGSKHVSVLPQNPTIPWRAQS